mmetsp:Transcript_102690/g.299563  ORF Transcript_102690/g.299563 Transcript_102690/m.299563 type:complete len:209 (+) Transcript_102690:99-725(+)
MASASALGAAARRLVLALAAVACRASDSDGEAWELPEASCLLQVALDVDSRADVQPFSASQAPLIGINKSLSSNDGDRGLEFEVAANGASTRSSNVSSWSLPTLPMQALVELNVSSSISGRPVTYVTPEYWSYWKISRCDHIYGISKLAWAILCNALAVFLVLLCIPLLLTCSRRRAAGSPLFDCTCGPSYETEEELGLKVSLNVFEM